ncbi:hypothetical protein [Legionella tunisiensis]|uniref:hypothetical protein n=1 Tax=Legionella tunisiensis TaxID=1034944 RepID=UPI0002DE4D33|nr:hypothetical protein [Legionella tunisiensis]
MNNATIINNLSLLSPFNQIEVESLTKKLMENCGLTKNNEIDHCVIRNKIQGNPSFADAQADIEFYQNGK